jgi:hypothetical protein
MGRVKEMAIDLQLNPSDIENELYFRNDYDYQYSEWLKSEEFVEYINAELDSTRPRYSEFDIMKATRYASEQITINPEEVGKQVYDMLYSEKIEEYLCCKKI